MYLIVDDVPYHAEESSHTGPLPGEGIFHKGRVVWLERNIDGVDPNSGVPVYADGIGVVVLAARYLQRPS